MTTSLLVLASTVLCAAPQRGELLDAASLRSAVEALATEHPSTVRVLPVGASRAGHMIQALRIGAADEVAGRPAILVVANLEGPMVWTSALALDLARQLAAGEAEGVAALLADTTVYIIPRANPDAAEARFRSPLAEVRASGAGVDNDRDGRQGEDEPADINGDGFITTLRVEDPEGTWIEDPADPRILIEADRTKGERGRYAIHPEGLDDDGDERIGEDAPFDAEVNANFAFRWEELAPRAGRYPTDEPEVLALSKFVLARPEIALVLTYGEEGNLVGDPSKAKSGRRGDEFAGVQEDDAALLGELGRRYRELTGVESEGGDEQAGSFAAWTYHHRGIPTLAGSPWSAPAELPKAEEEEEEEVVEEVIEDASDAEAELVPEEELEEEPEEEITEEVVEEEEAPKPSDEAKRLAWLEANEVADAFVAWKSFEHPTLGNVEVGGFRPYARIEPPPGRFEELADQELAFVVALGELLPRLALEELEAKSLGAGLFEVTAALENAALMPYSSAMARTARSVRPARVRLVLADGAELVAGSPQVLVSQLDGAGGRRELRWLVRADSANAITIEVDSDHAGSFSLQPEGN